MQFRIIEACSRGVQFRKVEACSRGVQFRKVEACSRCVQFRKTGVTGRVLLVAIIIYKREHKYLIPRLQLAMLAAARIQLCVFVCDSNVLARTAALYIYMSDCIQLSHSPCSWR